MTLEQKRKLLEAIDDFNKVLVRIIRELDDDEYSEPIAIRCAGNGPTI